MKPTPAILVLADGASFTGQAIGAAKDAFGEVAFNTAMTAYQEILTDPASTGLLLAFTFPHIGNCGVNPQDSESPGPKAAGIICAELNRDIGHWRSRQSLDGWLTEHGVSGISGIDTRALTIHLRNNGAQNGYISVEDLNPASVQKKALALPSMNGLNLAEKAGCREPYDFSTEGGRTVAVLDLGIRRSVLDQLARVGLSVRVWPADTPADSILNSGAAGAVLAGGPGDPAPCGAAISAARQLLGRLPLFGIGLGHQILALALGGQTAKMPFGRHGANHPVRDLATGRISITSQNHGFYVAADSLPDEAAVTEINVHDQTVAGLSAVSRRAFSVQYHPEAGPDAAHRLFEKFRDMINSGGVDNA